MVYRPKVQRSDGRYIWCVCIKSLFLPVFSGRIVMYGGGFACFST
jgi:hypothetical protein